MIITKVEEVDPTNLMSQASQEYIREKLTQHKQLMDSQSPVSEEEEVKEEMAQEQVIVHKA